MLRTILVLGILLLYVSIAWTQDSHYWNIQYGAKSSLLGGAVIGSVDDLSATFYNPGALSQIEERSFTISADVKHFCQFRDSDDYQSKQWLLRLVNEDFFNPIYYV